MPRLPGNGSRHRSRYRALRGNLLTDPTTHVPIDNQTTAAAGRATWRFDFTGFDVVARCLSADGNPRRGTASALVW